MTTKNTDVLNTAFHIDVYEVDGKPVVDIFTIVGGKVRFYRETGGAIKTPVINILESLVKTDA